MSKVDELNIYTGKDTLEALLEGKVLYYKGSKYKLEDGELKVDGEYSYATVNFLMQAELTEVSTPQVGDWVKVTTELGNIRTGQVTEISNSRVWATWDDNHLNSSIELNYPGRSWQILSPEEVSEYKREQTFVKVGRKLNEFKRGDIVYIESVYRVAIVASNNNTSLINLHGINEEGKGYTAKPHQLTPISFVEQQVDLS